MYAIIQSGSKQYRVQKGDIIEVELLDSEVGKKVEFKEVLFFSDGKTQKVGAPHVKKCLVLGEFLSIAAGEKKISYKYKRRKNYHLKKGSRQKYSKIKITEIKAA